MRSQSIVNMACQAFSDPEQFNRIANQYPEGILIVAHAGETFAGLLTCADDPI